MKLYLVRFGLLAAFTVFISCEEEIGINGIVRDRTTGNSIEGVKIKLSSDYRTYIVYSDTSGYFNTKETVKCGTKKCDNTFLLEFDMDGYEHLELDEKYLSDTASVDSIYNAYPTINLTPTVQE